MPPRRLADVRLRLNHPGVFIAIFTAIRATQLPRPWLYPLWWLAVCLLPLHLRVGALVLFGATLGFLAVVPANHIWFGMWISATFVLFEGPSRQRFVVRCQLTILYGFAGLAKLTPEWLSGQHVQELMLDAHGLLLPDIIALAGAVGVALAECALAWLLWRPTSRSGVLAVAGALHLSFWLGLGAPLRTAPPLVFFNGLAFSLLWWSTTRPAEPRRLSRGTG